MGRGNGAIALFMSLLVILLPLYSADALAVTTGTLRNIEVQGQDGIPSVVRSVDRLRISAEAQVSGDTSVTPDQLLLNTIAFTSCSPAQNSFFRCFYEDPSPQTIPSGLQTFTVQLKDDQGGNVVTRSGSYARDDTPPQIISASIGTQLVTAGQVNISVQVRDISQAGITDICAGITTVFLYDDAGTLIAAVPISGTTCEFTHTIERSASSFGDAGEKTLCVGAIDRFGQETPQAERSCFTFNYDPNGLQIDTSSFRIERNGRLLSFVKPNTVYQSLTISLDLTDPDGGIINPADVVLDLSNIGGGTQATPRTCTENGGTYTCQWQGISLTIGQDAPGEVPISAQDESGNQVFASVVPLLLDNSPPSLTSLESLGNGPDGTKFIGLENQLQATINEVGSGLDERDLRIQSAVHTGPATLCPAAGCYWNFTSPRGTDGQQIEFIVTGRDIAGNNLENGRSGGFFTIDRTAPEFTEVIYENENGLGKEFLRQGDEVTITATVEEVTSNVRAMGNFSQLVGLESVEGVCEEILEEFSAGGEEDEEDRGTGTWKCIWPEVGPLSPNNRATVTYTFLDSAGNEEVHEDRFSIAEAAEEETQFWSGFEVVSRSPEKFSRDLIAYAPMSMYMQLQFEPASDFVNADLSIVDITIDTCFDSHSFFDRAERTNGALSGRESWNQWMRFDFRQVSPFLDNGSILHAITMDCSFSVITRQGRQISAPQTISSNVTVEFFELPSGVIGQSVQDKIDQLKEETDDIGTLTSIRKVIQFIESICTLFAIYSSIISMLTTLHDTLGCLGWIFGVTCAGPKAGVGSIANALSTSADSIWRQTLAWLCAAATCTVVDKLIETFGSEGLSEWVGRNGWLRNPLGKAIGKENTDQECVRRSSPEKEYKCKSLGLPLFNYREPRSADGSSQLREAQVSLDGLSFDILDQRVVRNNIFFSVLFLCIPGFFDYLLKLRENKCNYALCLQNVAGGTPVEFCEKQYAFVNCKHVEGNWVALIPFQGLANSVSTLFAPFVALAEGDVKAGFFIGFAATNLICTGLCELSPCPSCAPTCIGCYLFKLWPDVFLPAFNTIKKLGDIEGFWGSFASASSPACEQLHGDGEDEEAAATPGQPTAAPELGDLDE